MIIFSYLRTIYMFVASLVCVKNARFYDSRETVNQIINGKKSLIRFGDGEFDIIEGKSIHYQSYDASLAAELDAIIKEYISGELNNLLVGMPIIMLIPNGIYFMLSRKLVSCRAHVRYFFKKYYDKKCIYADALIFRKGMENYYSQIWNSEKFDKVVFVHNDRKYADKLEQQIKKECIFVQVPAKNAYSNCSEIVKRIVSIVKKDKNNTYIVLISAGPCGKILGYRLHQNGMWVIDTGHCWDEPLEMVKLSRVGDVEEKYSKFYVNCR